MKVYGYDNAKRLLAVDLPIEKVAAAGIDPWRVDVFDEDPVTMRLGWNFRQRHFRKLRDLSFAYRGREPAVYVGLHDGSNSICLVGELNEEETTAVQIVLSKFSISDRPFAQHFAEYLARLRLGFRQTHFNRRGHGPSESEPRNAAAVTISGSTLCFDNGSCLALSDLAPQYVGNMLVERAFPCPLPEYVNWVFDHFQQWKPIVWGEAIGYLCRHEPCDTVNVALGNVDYKNLQKYLCETGFGSTLNIRYSDGITAFNRGGCTYLLICDVESYPFQSGMKNRISLIHGRTKCSKQRLYATRKDEITASRVAIFDLAKNQTRYMNPANGLIDVETVQRMTRRKPLLISDPIVPSDLDKKALVAA